MSPIDRSPFIASVEPVETRSTMASARPSRGATSTAPEREITSTAIPLSAKNRRATLGWDVAILTPARSSIDWYGEPAATAAARRQRP